jgi:hypothetical protein
MSAAPEGQRAEERLRRSVETMYAFIDMYGLPAVSEACALMQLDRLVRRYPAAARMSLRLLRRIPRHAPPGLPGWFAVSAPDEDVPVWMRADGSVYVATEDPGLLRLIAAALTRSGPAAAGGPHARHTGASEAAVRPAEAGP